MRQPKSRSARAAALALAVGAGPVLLLNPQRAAATNKICTSSGNWSNGAIWNPTGAPQQGDDAYVTDTQDFTAGTVTFDGAGSVTLTYGIVTVGVTGAVATATLQNNGFLFQAQQLALPFGGTYSQQSTGAASISTVNITGGTLAPNTFSFNAGTINHIAGTVSGPINCSQAYLLQAGTFNAGVSCNGTFDYANASGFGSVISFGTFIYDAPPSSTLQLDLTNHGAMVFNTAAASLRSLTNFGSPTLPAGKTLSVPTAIDVRGGTFTQLGSVTTPGLSVEGGTWAQGSGSLSVGIGSGELFLGSNNGVNSPLVGTFLLSGGTVTCGFLNISEQYSSGTFIQSGGKVLATTAMYLGGVNASRGYYHISSGTLIANTMLIGGQLAKGGSFIQDGGDVETTTLTINENAASQGAVTINGGTFFADLQTINHGAIAQTGGFTRFSRIFGAGSIILSGNSSMQVDSVRQRSVALSGNARIGPQFATDYTHRLESLTFDETGGTVHGSWDLKQNPMVIDYTGTSPLPALRRYLKSGYAGGNWNGTGLSSSSAADPAAGHTTALGYGEASTVLGAAGGDFKGVAADNSSILIKYTYYGDADLDGDADGVDIGNWATNFTGELGGAGSKVWTQGDWDYDGDVDGVDAGRWAQTFTGELGGGGLGSFVIDNPNISPAAAAILRGMGVTVVPEPAFAQFIPFLAFANPWRAGALRRARKRSSLFK